MTLRLTPYALTFAAVTGFLAACSEKLPAATSAQSAPALAPPAAAASEPASGASASTSPASGASASTSPPVSVTMTKATQRDMDVTIKATGTVTPLSIVDVKPQVTSLVTSVNFKEGQFVKKGDLLFTLDSRTDEANLAKAKAQLAKDNAALADAKRQFARNQELVGKGFISQGALDTSQSNMDAQTAAVAADKAAVDAATTALSFNRITAAQSGRVGAINVFVGSAVQANQTTLVTITQLDPIAIAFNLPQSNLSDALHALQGAGTIATAQLPGSTATYTGTLRFIDNAVDAASGTIKMKAIFANPSSKLWPGGYADITLSARTIKDAVVIPTASIIQNARGTIVYVAENSKAVLRPIKVLFTQGEDSAVSGVKVGESVVADGKQNLRPNAAVIERVAKSANAPASSSPASAASSATGPKP